MSSSGFISRNPATGKVSARFEPHSDAEVERRLQRSASAFREYRRTSIAERASWMVRAAALLEAGKDGFGRVMTFEMGKTLRAAVQEVEKCAWACRWYAENAARLMADEPAEGPPAPSFIRYQPLGPVLAIMPWNFPFWQVFRFIAPGLMAGNVGLLKHASNVPRCALAIEEVLIRAGFPEGVFQVLMIESNRVGPVIADARVAAVTLTGSLDAGSAVAAAAGKHIKPTVLELGGSDPFIVMPSADMNGALAAAVQARILNNGQSCIAAKRFIIHERIADEFQRGFVDRMAALKVGNPMEGATDIGPLATDQVLESLQAQVDRTVQSGARVLLGGRRLDSEGYYFPPTVLVDIPPGSPAQCEELFGPVAAIFRATSMEDAVAQANDSRFGLGACAWTKDSAERDLFIDRIESGLAFVNGIVASDPRLPFGGIKQSGYGRELSGAGIREFVNVKTVAVHDWTT